MRRSLSGWTIDALGVYDLFKSFEAGCSGWQTAVRGCEDNGEFWWRLMMR